MDASSLILFLVLLSVIVGALIGVAVGWFPKPRWATDHPPRVVALVVGLVVVAAIAAVMLEIAKRSERPGAGSDDDPGPVTSTTTTTTTTAALPQGRVPSELVGSWGGGSTGATADRSYTFGAEGTVLYRRLSEDIVGTAVADGDTLTLYFPDLSPQAYRWSVDDSYELDGYTFANLYLDGFTFVRQDSP